MKFADKRLFSVCMSQTIKNTLFPYRIAKMTLGMDVLVWKVFVRSSKLNCLHTKFRMWWGTQWEGDKWRLRRRNKTNKKGRKREQNVKTSGKRMDERCGIRTLWLLQKIKRSGDIVYTRLNDISEMRKMWPSRKKMNMYRKEGSKK